MKIATFNIQNIFMRSEVLIFQDYGINRSSLTEELDQLLRQKERTPAHYDKMRLIASRLDLAQEINYIPRTNLIYSSHLNRQFSNKTLPDKSTINWKDAYGFSRRAIGIEAIENKARVIKEVNADILVLQEVESRMALLQFNDQYLQNISGEKYTNITYMPGNDSFGRGLGLLLKKGYEVESLRTYANINLNTSRKLFEKDFQEYRVMKPNGNRIIIFNAHFDEINIEDCDSKKIIKKQSKVTHNIFKNILLNETENVFLMGSLNAPRYSSSLANLLHDEEIKQVVKHSKFNVDFDRGIDAAYYSLGAFGKGVNLKQKDHILTSLSSYNRINSCGLNRKGVWPQKKSQWRTYKTIQNKNQSASKHPILWVIVDP